MGKLTPPEPEVESSPVSAKGSNLFRFWIAELAVYTQLVLIFKNAKYSKKDVSSSTHERSRERGGGLITGEPSGGHMTCFRVGKREGTRMERGETYTYNCEGLSLFVLVEA